ncbi:DEAD/DEAH box helicase [Pseudomonas citronellolis]|uniref:DEAD/DEAH box helicase n=1 Tax=Pseudomonas citronellolis TaxID=53408 RepID=UPI0018D7443F|nr:DEAD/DEAH box helicase [Pseudomonas citronellolis]MBH3434870.1 DEAD/DEAH box helicase [Pseudomonas citronellolis]
MNFIFNDQETKTEAISATQKYLSNAEETDEITQITALEAAHFLLTNSNENSELNLALAVICYSAESELESSLAKQLLADCIDASRNYLYLDMLIKGNTSWKDSETILSSFRRSFYTTEHDTTLTKQQKEILETYLRHPRLVVSAPTSFGKTRIIQEIIINKNYKNIAIIMPTIALMSETVDKFRKDSLFSKYKIINSTTSHSDKEHSIYILTPEKLDLMLDQQEELKFDFFAMDEIYKIQDDKDRRAVFANVLYTLINSGADFYLIGPYFKRFSETFLAKTNSLFLRYSTEIVQKEVYDLFKHEGETVNISGKSIKIAKTNETNAKRLAKSLDDQKIFYYKDTRGVETYAKKIAASLSPPSHLPNELIEYISESISSKWSLIDCLKKGVAFHHGSMPRHIQSEIVEFFNKGKVHSLFCTTTLTEGVNTTAKNIIVLSNMKGEEPLTGFDYKNIKGRAGRFLHHFTGRVINLVDVPEAEREEIEFYYFDGGDLSTDELLKIQNSDLTPEDQERKRRTVRLLNDKRIPVDLIKQNKYIAVEKQIALITHLRENPNLIGAVYFLGSYPEKEKLSLILELCHRFLFTRKDVEDRGFSLFDIDKQVKYYIYFRPTIKELIANQNRKTEDAKIRSAFKLISRWFEFALPKYLTCFNELYNFTATERNLPEISLGWIITLLQYGFESTQAIALKDSGVPADIIKKIENKLEDCTSIEEIKARLYINPKIIDDLNDYERSLLAKHL